jgi:DegV family protein with EDD domain
MEKFRQVAIVTDTAADLPSAIELKTKFGITSDITQIPLSFSFDGEDCSTLTENQFHQLIIDNPRIIPKTAAPSIEKFSDTYSDLTSRGFDVLSINISEKLSRTYESALIAAQEFPHRVNVINSGTISLGQGFQVIEAQKMAEQEQNLNILTQQINLLKEKVYTWTVLPNIDYVKAGGRIGNLSAWVGNLLHIIPIVRIDHNQPVTAVARTRKISGAVDWLSDQLQKIPQIRKIGILDFAATKTRDLIVEKIIQNGFPAEDIITRPLGKVASVHGGPGTLGVAVICQ